VDIVLLATIAIVALALLFDFTNGFHDAANATATVVATKALKPRTAVLVSAFNFVAMFVVGTAVANTVAKTVKLDHLGSVGENAIPYGLRVTFAALIAAIFWNYFTWQFGMPSSSSHALIGGLVGAGLSAAGRDAVAWSGVEKVLVAIVVSPLVAFTIAFLAMFIVGAIQKFTGWGDDARPFKWAQIVSSACVSFGHGANDAQKTMGIIAATLAAGGYISTDKGNYTVPLWVEVSAYSMIALGTLYGGWRIIETMGLRLTRLNANSGAAANIGATTAIFGATELGVPISTTHAAGSSVMGAGVASGTGIAWRKAGEMLAAWVVTVPAAATVAFLTYKLTVLPGKWAAAGSITATLVLLGWSLRLMIKNEEGAEEVAEMLPSDEELHTGHGMPHPHITSASGEGKN
jgi:inorganic phosphate transporter, PiT family